MESKQVIVEQIGIDRHKLREVLQSFIDDGIEISAIVRTGDVRSCFPKSSVSDYLLIIKKSQSHAGK